MTICTWVFRAKEPAIAVWFTLKPLIRKKHNLIHMLCIWFRMLLISVPVVNHNFRNDYFKNKTHSQICPGYNHNNFWLKFVSENVCGNVHVQFKCVSHTSQYITSRNIHQHQHLPTFRPNYCHHDTDHLWTPRTTNIANQLSSPSNISYRPTIVVRCIVAVAMCDS